MANSKYIRIHKARLVQGRLVQIAEQLNAISEKLISGTDEESLPELMSDLDDEMLGLSLRYKDFIETMIEEV